MRDDPVDGWAGDHGRSPVHQPVDSRDAFGLRADERPIPPVTSREPPRFDPPPQRTRVAPERRVRFVEMRSPEERVAAPPARSSGFRRAASVTALLLVAAGLGAGWVLMDGTIDLPTDLSMDLPLNWPIELPFDFNQVASVDDTRSDLPLRASEAPIAPPEATRSAEIAAKSEPPVRVIDPPAAGPVVPEPSASGPDPVLSSDLITEMKISEPRPVDGDVTPAPATTEPPPVVAAPPVDVVENPAASPANPLPDTASSPPPAGDTMATLVTEATPGGDQIAAIVAATIEPPRPRIRPDGLQPPASPGDTSIVATTAPPAGEETLPPASGLAPDFAPDFAPTGSLPESSTPAVGPGPVDEPGRTVGRTVIGRIIPPAEMNARLGSGDRRVVGRIIPPEEFSPPTNDPFVQPGPIPPLDVGATPFAGSLADEGFDTETDSITTEGPFADIGGGSADRRVVVHVPRFQTGAMDEAVSAIPGKVEVRVVDIAPEADMVRYYYAEDRDAALSLRRELAGAGGDAGAVGISDFTNYRPQPRKGLIEVWLSDRR